jgi:hypothetical protein
MRRVAAALAFVALTALRAVAADDAAPPKPKTKLDPEIGRCVKRVRAEERTCLRSATERCRATAETALAGCYGSNADCARACVTAQATCRADPSVDQDGCKLACGSDQKVENQRCRVEPDMKKCQGDAKVKALKCKQKCAVDAAPALQACMRRFDECLVDCNRTRPVP